MRQCKSPLLRKHWPSKTKVAKAAGCRTWLRRAACPSPKERTAGRRQPRQGFYWCSSCEGLWARCTPPTSTRCQKWGAKTGTTPSVMMRTASAMNNYVVILFRAQVLTPGLLPILAPALLPVLAGPKFELCGSGAHLTDTPAHLAQRGRGDQSMRIDQDYLKRLLEACQASDKPTFDIEDLELR